MTQIVWSRCLCLSWSRHPCEGRQRCQDVPDLHMPLKNGQTGSHTEPPTEFCIWLKAT